MRPAIGGSVSVRNCTDARVLNRKWGSTCACISFSSASAACFESRLRSASLRSICVCARLAELEQEQHADEKTGAEGADERRHERVGQRGYLDQAISLDAETISLD